MEKQKRANTRKATVTRLRTGCWTCRRRGYRCDEAKPACHTCRRLAVPCEGYGVRLKWQHRWSQGEGVQNEGTGTRGTGLGHPAPPLPVLPGPHSRTDVFLLQHYVFTVASLLSSTPDRSVNTYLTTVLPLMLQHDCLRHTALALSAVHLARRFPATAFAAHAARLQGAGLRGLLRRLDARQQHLHQHNDPDPGADEAVLATILLFGLLGVFEADAGLWSRHLEGAAAFLAAYRDRAAAAAAGNDTGTSTVSLAARTLLEIYTYHEVLAAIALRRAPRLPFALLRGRQPEGAGTSSREDAPADQWSAFSGRPEKKAVFLSAVDSLLSLVAALARVRSAPGEDQQAATAATAARLVEKLRQWRCPGDGYSVETRNTAEAMRQAGILLYWLKDATCLAESTSDEPRRAVDTIVACLRPIAADHSAVASHVWPLYMAGVAAQTAAQRAFIGQRLDEMMAVRGMQSIEQVRASLDRTWSAGGSSGHLVLF